MIKFSGILSEECKYYFLRNAQKGLLYIILIISIVFIGIAIIMGIFCDWIVFASVLPGCLILITCAAFPPKQKFITNLIRISIIKIYNAK